MARSGEIDGYAGSRITRIYGNRSWEQAFGKQSFFFGVVKQYSNSVWVMFLVTMALAPVTIWIFKKYFPYFTAQKDLFPVGDKVLKRKE